MEGRVDQLLKLNFASPEPGLHDGMEIKQYDLSHCHDSEIYWEHLALYVTELLSRQVLRQDHP